MPTWNGTAETDARLREQAEKALRQEILLHGYLHLNKVTPVLREAGVDTAVYGGKGPKLWLKNEFSGTFSVVENPDRPGSEIVLMSGSLLTPGKNVAGLSPREIAEGIARIRDLIAEKGQIRFSEIPRLLKENGIGDYRAYTSGIKLKVWLLMTFKEFRASEDGFTLLVGKAGARAAAPERETAASGEDRQLFRFCYFRSWSQNARRLGQLGVVPEPTQDALTQQLARQLGLGLLGQPGLLLSAVRDEEPRLALDTGLKTGDGLPVYGIFDRNPVENAQFWRLQDFCTPGGEDGPNGAWLSRRFGLGGGIGAVRDYEELRAGLEELRARTGELIPRLRDYLERLESGYAPKDRLADALRELEEDTERFSARLAEGKLLSDRSTEFHTLEELSRALEGGGTAAGLLRQAASLLADTADAADGLFRAIRLVGPDAESTPQRDGRRLRGEQPEPGALRDRLEAYTALEAVLSADRAEQVGPQLQKICDAFPELPGFTALMLVHSADQAARFFEGLEGGSFSGALKTAAALLDRGSAARRQSAESETAEPVSVDELRLRVLNGEDGGPVRWLEDVLASAPRDDRTRRLILGEADGEKRTPETDTEEMTFFGAASRLLADRGNGDRQAERWLLLGLEYDEELCAPALLRLYREADEKRAFEAVWVRYSDNVETSDADRLYWFRIQCAEDPASALRQVRTDVQLQYRPEYLRELIPAAGAVGEEALAARFGQRLAELEAAPEPNELEKAAIEGDTERLSALLDRKEVLEGLDYTSGELDRFRDALSEELFKGKGAYETGLRLYALQKNKHRLAERWLWQGLSGEWRDRCDRLLGLLAEEERWEECAALFRSNPQELGKRAACRLAYLKARLHQGVSGAGEDILRYLQDCLQLLGEDPALEAALRACAEKETDGLYAGVLEIHGRMEKDPLLKSAVIPGLALRELLYDHASLQQAGLSAEQIALAGKRYQAGDYSRGVDAVGVARRVYELLGGYHGAAAALAALLPEDGQMLELQWQLAAEEGDREKQDALLGSRKELRTAHRSEYLDLLFRKEEYAAYLDALTGEDEADPVVRLRAMLARLRLGTEPGEEELEELCTLPIPDPALLAELMAALCDRGRADFCGRLVRRRFSEWFDGGCPPETLSLLASGGGRFDEAFMEDLRKQALEAGETDLAIYCSRHFGAGSPEDRGEAFLLERAEAVKGRSASEQVRELDRLKTLYGELPGELKRRHIRLRLKELLSTTDGMALVEAVSALADSADPSPDTARGFLEGLRGEALCGNPSLYPHLRQLCTGAGKETLLPEFYQNEYRKTPEGPRKQNLRGRLCDAYLFALERGCFTEAYGEGLQAMIRELKDNPIFRPQVLLAAYYREKQAGRSALADMVLLTMVSEQRRLRPEQRDARIASEAEARWPEGEPDTIELFEQMLETGSLEELEAYIQACKEYVRPVPEARQRIREQGDADVLNREDGNLALTLLLSSPKSAELWELCTQKVPLRVSEGASVKFLILLCRRLTGEEASARWAECIRLCERSGLDDLLLSAYLLWAQSPEADTFFCRRTLEEALVKNGDYLKRWKEDDRLSLLMDALIRRAESGQELRYDAVRSLARIAVKTWRPDCLDKLQRSMGDRLVSGQSGICAMIFAHLAEDDRIPEAREWLRQIAPITQVSPDLKYGKLMLELSGMGEEELRAWKQEEDHRLLLRLILPDGNYPNVQQIQELVYEGIGAGRHEQTAGLLENLLAATGNKDAAILLGLLDLCRSRRPDDISVLHRSLRRMIEVGASNESYIRWKKDELAARLAVLNAVLLIRVENGRIAPDAFDLEPAGDYYRRVQGASASNLNAPAALNACQSAVFNELHSLREKPGEQADRCEAYLCCVTDDWTELLLRKWREKDPAEACSRLLQTSIHDYPAACGFSRSLLRAMAGMEREEQEGFWQWVRTAVPTPPGRLDGRQQQVQFIDWTVTRAKQGGPSDWELLRELPREELQRILSMPMEDYSFFGVLEKKLLLPAAEKKDPLLRPLASLICGLCCYPMLMTEFWKRANDAFGSGQDYAAACFFRAMEMTANAFRISANTRLLSEKDRQDHLTACRSSLNYHREYYTTCRRLAAFFGGETWAVSRIRDRRLSVWTTLNLALALIDGTLDSLGKRAGELPRLRAEMGEKQRKWVDTLLILTDPDRSFGEKIAALESVEEPEARHHLIYIWKFPFDKRQNIKAHYSGVDGVYVYSLDHYLIPASTPREQIERLNQTYVALGRELAGRRGIVSPYGDPLHPLLVVRRAAPAAFLASSAGTEPAEEPGRPTAMPSFAEDAECAESGEQTLEELLKEHAGLMDFRQRLELSRRILARAKQEPCSARTLGDALLRYGVDKYSLLITSRSEEDKRKANDLIRELMGCCELGVNTEGCRRLAGIVRSVGLTGLLRAYGSLEDLLDGYGEDRPILAKMRDLLDGDGDKADLDRLLRILDRLSQNYRLYAAADAGKLRETLQRAYQSLDDRDDRFASLSWAAHVRSLIQESINAIDQRPLLAIRLMNRGRQFSSGCFSGCVYNNGREAAGQVVLQAAYGESRSLKYSVGSLAPGARAAFSIKYAVPEGTAELPYHLDLEYLYGNELQQIHTKQEVLSLSPQEELQLPAEGFYKTAAQPFTVDPATGEVVGKGWKFVGRRTETATLRRLVAGDGFSSYQSAIVCGVRRTGKTTLLHYFQTYAEARCRDAVCVYVDVQDSAKTVQDVFINKVLDTLNRGPLREDRRWQALTEEWKKPDSFDRSPKQLQFFFRDLRDVLGKGLILIVDEIDRLFEAVMSNAADGNSLDGGLFDTLGSLVNSALENVHFVLCGSNWLIRYQNTGSTLSQMFQRFDSMISVGRLEKQDVRELLCSVSESYPELDMTQAVDTVYDCTGGLVWFVKLLGEQAIRCARRDGRAVVYPYDVYQSLPQVICGKNCRQFTEGCDPQGLELRVILAMESQAVQPNSSVSLQRICELLDRKPEEVLPALNWLLRLNLAEEVPARVREYRFCLDIYRRYFRHEDFLLNQKDASAIPQLPAAEEIFTEYRPAGQDYAAGTGQASARALEDDWLLAELLSGDPEDGGWGEDPKTEN